jgi:hypothetical protein
LLKDPGTSAFTTKARRARSYTKKARSAPQAQRIDRLALRARKEIPFVSFVLFVAWW